MDSASQRRCQQLLDALVSHDLSWPFLEPVDPIAMQIPTYFELIKNPMDLSTMQTKLSQHEYASPAQLLDDLVLMCQNAIAFNEQDTSEESVCAMAKQLMEFGLEQWELLFGENQLMDPRALLESKVRSDFLHRARDANLRSRWRKHSFVANFNRHKIQQRRQAALDAATAAASAAAAASMTTSA